MCLLSQTRLVAPSAAELNFSVGFFYLVSIYLCQNSSTFLAEFCLLGKFVGERKVLSIIGDKIGGITRWINNLN